MRCMLGCTDPWSSNLWMILKLSDKVPCNVSFHGRRKIKNRFSDPNCAGTKRVSLKCTAGMWHTVWRFRTKKLWHVSLAFATSVCPLVWCANSRNTERLSIVTYVKNPHRNWPRVLDLLSSELRKGHLLWSVRTALYNYRTYSCATSNAFNP